MDQEEGMQGHIQGRWMYKVGKAVLETREEIKIGNKINLTFYAAYSNSNKDADGKVVVGA